MKKGQPIVGANSRFPHKKGDDKLDRAGSVNITVVDFPRIDAILEGVPNDKRPENYTQFISYLMGLVEVLKEDSTQKDSELAQLREEFVLLTNTLKERVAELTSANENNITLKTERDNLKVEYANLETELKKRTDELATCNLKLETAKSEIQLKPGQEIIDIPADLAPVIERCGIIAKQLKGEGEPLISVVFKEFDRIYSNIEIPGQ